MTTYYWKCLIYIPTPLQLCCIYLYSIYIQVKVKWFGDHFLLSYFLSKLDFKFFVSSELWFVIMFFLIFLSLKSSTGSFVSCVTKSQHDKYRTPRKQNFFPHILFCSMKKDEDEMMETDDWLSLYYCIVFSIFTLILSMLLQVSG